MKVVTTPKEEFIPITVTILIETESELRGILATFNTPVAVRVKAGSYWGTVSKDVDDIEMGLWEAVELYSSLVE